MVVDAAAVAAGELAWCFSLGHRNVAADDSAVSVWPVETVVSIPGALLTSLPLLCALSMEEVACVLQW